MSRKPSSQPQIARQPVRIPSLLEHLETRRLLTTLTVTSTADTGAGTLRQAILDANAASGADTIAFALPAAPTGSLPTVLIASPLPTVTGILSIDGLSQASNGAGIVARVAVRPTSVGSYFDALTFSSSAPRSAVRGMRFERFSTAITMEAGETTIAGNEFGNADTGHIDANLISVSVLSQTQIGGDVETARNYFFGGREGIRIYGTENRVEGARFGTRGTSAPAGTGPTVGVIDYGIDNVIIDNVFRSASIAVVLESGTAVTIEGNTFGESGYAGQIGIAVDARNSSGTIGGPLAAARNRFVGVGYETGGTTLPAIDVWGGDMTIRYNDFVNNPGKSIRNLGFGVAPAVPQLQNVQQISAGTQIDGVLQGKPNTAYLIDLYLAPRANVSGLGDGAYHASVSGAITTDAAGFASFTRTVASVDSDAVFSATATEQTTGCTSEFSAPRGVNYAPTVPLVTGRVSEDGVAGSVGISRVTVYADLDGNLVASDDEPQALTDGNGNYQLQLPSTGQFTLRVSGARLESASPSQIVVTATEPVTPDKNFVIRRTGSIGGVLYVDRNRNGVRDTGDTVLAGRTVIRDFGTAAQTSTVTAGDGTFQFTNVTVGSHTIRYVDLPSDVTTLTGGMVSASILSNQAQTINLRTLMRQGSISGTLFRDFTGNGMREEGESGVADIVVWADLNNNTVWDANEPGDLTDASGAYAVAGVDYGTFPLRAMLRAGWTLTSNPTLTLDAAQIEKSIGFKLPGVTGIIAGSVWNADQNGQSAPLRFGGRGHMVFIDSNNNSLPDAGERSMITDEQGFYAFDNLPAGTHVVRAILGGNKALVDPLQLGALLVTLGDDEVKLRQSFAVGGDFESVVRGMAFNDLDRDAVFDNGEAVLSGVRVFLDADNDGVLDTGEFSVLTAADGTYEIRHLSDGTTVVRAEPPSSLVSTRTDPAIRLNLGSGQVVAAQNFGFASPAVTTTLQAESATMSGGTAKGSSNGGYNGAGYADFGGQNSAVAWTISRSSAGSAKLEFRYANGATTNRPLQVLVNNVLVGTINCEPTGAWTIWKNTSLPGVQLPAGNVVIKAVASTSNGGANVDQLAITSAGTTEEPPPPPPPSDVKFFEAENATMSGGTVKSAGNAGFTGSGFADYAGQGSAVQFNVTRSASGAVTLVFRYANGSTTNRPLQVLVNGNIVGTIACAPTGSWTTWKNVSLANITLPAGTTAIKAIASTSAGGANLDSLTIESGTVVPPPPPPTDSSLTLEAESAQMKNGTGKGTSNSGFAGTGYADYGGQGSAVDFVFNRTATSTVSLQLRYANGATTSRPLQVLVNGNVVGTFACAPTGSWTTWQTATLTNIALPSGAITIRVVASTSVGGGNVDWLKVIAN